VTDKERYEEPKGHGTDQIPLVGDTVRSFLGDDSLGDPDVTEE